MMGFDADDRVARGPCLWNHLAKDTLSSHYYAACFQPNACGTYWQMVPQALLPGNLVIAHFQLIVENVKDDVEISHRNGAIPRKCTIGEIHL